MGPQLANNVKQGCQIIHRKIVDFVIMLYLSNNNNSIFNLNMVGLKVN